jgi:hypothetical protein
MLDAERGNIRSRDTAFATLVTSLASAEPQRSERSRASAIHLKRLKQRTNYRNLYLGPRESILPALNPDPEQWLCSTDHDFCSGFFGDNG